MVFRLCWLVLAVFLASCSGESDSEESHSPSTFTPPVVVRSDIPILPVLPHGNVIFSYGANDGVASYSVVETPTRKAQTISLKGTTIPFTATAGHLIASGWMGAPPMSDRYREAAIFYTAYTRDDLPRATRPVTFIFNGGPGGASADLDLGFLGPKEVVENAPTAANLLLKDNPNTLLDKTDLVFVDPVGTGYSVATWPSQNSDFWGVDSDAVILSKFITKYTNTYNRQSSPKYIYGVSYGGFRAPIIARLLLESGTHDYVADPSNQPANILSGLILNSPVLDAKTDCYGFYVSCGGALPTYGMIADFHKKSVGHEGLEIEAILADIRSFVRKFNQLYDGVFSGVSQETPDRSKWDAYLQKPEAAVFLNKLYELTGIGKTYMSGDGAKDNPWIDNPNMDTLQFAEKFDPAKGKLLINDGRKFLSTQKLDPALDHKDVYYEYVQRYQADYINYKSQPRYMGYNGTIIASWDYEPDPKLSLSQDRWRTIIPDMAFSLTLNPKLKALIQHGYYDLNTPFHQSELNIGNAELSAKIPVKIYEGGHGVAPWSIQSYGPVLQDLAAFYGQPQAPMIAALNSPIAERKDHE